MEERDSDNIKKLLLEYITGAIDKKGLEILTHWRQEAKSHEELFQRLISEDFLPKNREECILSPQDTEKEWQQICRRTFRKKQSVGNVFSVMLPYFCYLYVSVCFY